MRWIQLWASNGLQESLRQGKTKSQGDTLSAWRWRPDCSLPMDMPFGTSFVTLPLCSSPSKPGAFKIARNVGLAVWAPQSPWANVQNEHSGRCRRPGAQSASGVRPARSIADGCAWRSWRSSGPSCNRRQSRPVADDAPWRKLHLQVLDERQHGAGDHLQGPQSPLVDSTHAVAAVGVEVVDDVLVGQDSVPVLPHLGQEEFEYVVQCHDVADATVCPRAGLFQSGWCRAQSLVEVVPGRVDQP